MSRLVYVVAGMLLCTPLSALAQGKTVAAETVVAQAQKGPGNVPDQQKTTTPTKKETDKKAPMKKKREKAGGCG